MSRNRKRRIRRLADLEEMKHCSECNIFTKCQLLRDPFVEELRPKAQNDLRYWCDNCFTDRMKSI